MVELDGRAVWNGDRRLGPTRIAARLKDRVLTNHAKKAIGAARGHSSGAICILLTWKRGLIMKVAIVLMMACLGGAELSHSGDAKKLTSPILVELFTSEGCSSCPPADAWLQQLDTSQPIAGAQAIVLSEHVDYWNHDGWKDPYSSSLFTDRQSHYVRALGLSSPYTPQVIVGGKSELRLNDPQQVSHVFMDAGKAPQIPVSIGTINIEGNSPALLRAHIEVDGTGEKRNGDIYAVVALDHAVSQVLRGENGGRRLSHVAVAQEFVKIGKLEKGKTFTQEFQAKLNVGTDPRNLRLVVFVQEPELGRVLGSAVQESPFSGK